MLREREPTSAGVVDKPAMGPGVSRLPSDANAAKTVMDSTTKDQQVDALVSFFRNLDPQVRGGFTRAMAEMTPTPGSSEASTPTTEELPSPLPSYDGADGRQPPSRNRNLPYQATVEDEAESQAGMTESVAESDSNTPESPQESCSNVSSADSRCSTPASSVVESSVSSKASSNCSPPKQKPILVRSGPSTPCTESPQSSPRASRPTVHFSERHAVFVHSPSDPVQQCKETPARILPTDLANKDFSWSAVDLKWGRLFNEDGEPTLRLGQFLRGIANYLVTEYSPVNSLVVTPEKLYTFYSRFKLDSEVFPFRHIFDARSPESLKSLEYLYHDLDCEYHLVQNRPGSKPRVPALTPTGFQIWMVRHILAFPDQEFKRLNRVVAELPVTADGPSLGDRSERLPKQLSRHLLPARHDKKIHEIVVSAVTEWIKDAKPADRPSTRPSVYENSSGADRKTKPSDEAEGALCRYKPKERDTAYHSSSKDCYKSRDSCSREYSRDVAHAEPTTDRHLPRASSEGNINQDRDLLLVPTSSHRSRTPAPTNRYRYSVPIISTVEHDRHERDSRRSHGSSGHSTGSGPSSRSSSYASYPKVNSGERRSREQVYRVYQDRDLGKAPEKTTQPRGRDSRRENLVLSLPSEATAGLTYEEFLRSRPSSSRSASYR